MHPNVRVEIDGVRFELMLDLLRAEVESGDPPDIVQQHAFAAGATGIAVPLDDVWGDRLSEREFLSGSVEDVTWAGTRYGIPLDANAMALLVNQAHVSGSRAAVPEDPYSFADLRALAAKLTEGKRRAIALPSSTWAAYGWIRANGGEVVTADPAGQPSFTFDRAENVEALAFLGELVRDGLAVPPIGSLGDRTDAYALFRSEGTSMHATGTWDLAALAREQLDWEPAVLPMPRGVSGEEEGGTALGGSSLFVPLGSQHVGLAVDFMVHLTSDRYALRLAREEGRLPVRVRLYEEPFFAGRAMRTFLDQMTRAHPFLLEAFPEQHALFREAVRRILQGEMDAGEALALAQRDVEAMAG